MAYASIGMGARSEQLFGAGERQGTASSTVTGTVGQLGAGLRVRLADLGADWRLRLKLGADASLPFSDRSVAFGAEQRTLLEPRLALRIGIVVENR